VQVSECIVVFFEVIHIHHEQGQGMRVAFTAPDFPFKGFVECAAVEEVWRIFSYVISIVRCVDFDQRPIDFGPQSRAMA
jgi:hypothetical protein